MYVWMDMYSMYVWICMVVCMYGMYGCMYVWYVCMDMYGMYVWICMVVCMYVLS